MSEPDPTDVTSEQTGSSAPEPLPGRVGMIKRPIIGMFVGGLIAVIVLLTVGAYIESPDYFLREHYGSIVAAVAIVAAAASAVSLFGHRLSAGHVDGRAQVDTQKERTRRPEKTYHYGIVPPDGPGDIYYQFRYRMREDEARLRGNAGLNLIVGIVFAILALGVLAYPMIDPVVQATNWLFIMQAHLPRTAVGLLSQLLSFFFLRLYSINQQDLKHNKNEVTNFDMKMLAIMMAQTNPEIRSMVAAELARSERNFILRKGERTIVSEIESDYNELRRTLVDLLAVTPRTETPQRSAT